MGALEWEKVRDGGFISGVSTFFVNDVFVIWVGEGYTCNNHPKNSGRKKAVDLPEKH